MNTNYKPMPELLAEIDAALAPYGITRITGKCEIDEPWGKDGVDAQLCGKKAVTYCADCGKETCAAHAVVCCVETRCVGCAMFHVCPIVAIERMDS